MPFCDTCYPHFHKNKNVNHTFVALVAFCVECGDKVGRWQCTTCTDLFCKKVQQSFHRLQRNIRVGFFSISPKGSTPKPWNAGCELSTTGSKSSARATSTWSEAEAIHDQGVAQEVQQLELQKQEVAAIIIQTAYRGDAIYVVNVTWLTLLRHARLHGWQSIHEDGMGLNPPSSQWNSF